MMEDTQTAETPDTSKTDSAEPESKPTELSQDSVLDEIRSAGKDGRKPDFSAAKTHVESPDYKTKLADRLAEKPEAVKFAAPNPNIAETQKSVELIASKLEMLTKHLDTTKENTIERMKTEIQIEELEAKATQAVEAYRSMIMKEFSDACSSDSTFKEQHDYYSKHMGDADDVFFNAVMNDSLRIDILKSLYKWLDQPGAFQAFMGAAPEVRMNSLNIVKSNLKYGNRINLSSNGTQVVADRLKTIPETQTMPLPANPPKPNIAPGNGLDGGVDMDNQEAILRNLRRR